MPARSRRWGHSPLATQQIPAALRQCPERTDRPWCRRRKRTCSGEVESAATPLFIFLAPRLCRACAGRAGNGRACAAASAIPAAPPKALSPEAVVHWGPAHIDGERQVELPQPGFCRTRICAVARAGFACRPNRAWRAVRVPTRMRGGETGSHGAMLMPLCSVSRARNRKYRKIVGDAALSRRSLAAFNDSARPSAGLPREACKTIA